MVSNCNVHLVMTCIAVLRSRPVQAQRCPYRCVWGHAAVLSTLYLLHPQLSLNMPIEMSMLTANSARLFAKPATSSLQCLSQKRARYATLNPLGPRSFSWQQQHHRRRPSFNGLAALKEVLHLSYWMNTIDFSVGHGWSQEKEPQLLNFLRMVIWAQQQLGEKVEFPRINDLTSAALADNAS